MSVPSRTSLSLLSRWNKLLSPRVKYVANQTVCLYQMASSSGVSNESYDNLNNDSVEYTKLK